MNLTFSGVFHVVAILLLSIATLGGAVSFAVRPVDRKLGILRPMTWATLFSILAGIAAGIGATALRTTLPEPAEAQRDVTGLFMNGLAEAMVPPVLGFVVLAISWLLVSVGLRRQD